MGPCRSNDVQPNYRQDSSPEQAPMNINWTTRPHEMRAAARARAVAAIHANHCGGLTQLEKAYYLALKEGRITPDGDI